MSPLSTNDLLNRLLVLHTRSLPMYLSYAPPHHMQSHPAMTDVMANIVTLQKQTADRLATLILSNHGTLEFGEFPMAFTALHDLSAEYLLERTIERQQREIAYIEKCVKALANAPYAQAVAQETLGEAKGHLEALRELNRPNLAVAH